jgi:hypothetical protein
MRIEADFSCDTTICGGWTETKISNRRRRKKPKSSCVLQQRDTTQQSKKIVVAQGSWDLVFQKTVAILMENQDFLIVCICSGAGAHTLA